MNIEPSAKAIIVRDDSVLLIKYEDSTYGLGTWYSLPGGRQKFGEDLRAAVARECREEVDADVAVGELLFIREYIHANHELAGIGRDQHKIEFMFLCRLLSEPSSTNDDDDQAALEWVPFDRLQAVNIYPQRLNASVERIRDAALEGIHLGDSDVGVEYWGDSY